MAIKLDEEETVTIRLKALELTLRLYASHIPDGGFNDEAVIDTAKTFEAFLLRDQEETK